MLGHYLVLAARTARRAPLAAAVNVVTLAIGLVAFLTAYAFVAFWDRAERHFVNADRTYALTTSFRFFGGSFARNDVLETPRQVAELLATDFPELEAVARAIVMDRETAVSSGDRAVRLVGVAVDAAFLEIFDLPFAAGDRRTALSEPRSVVLTREQATRLFGADEPLGRRVLVGNLVEATVTGVIDAIPEPSHLGRSAFASLGFDMLASMDVQDALRASLVSPGFLDAVFWLGGEAFTYLLLPADGSLTAQRLEEQLPAFVARHVPPEEAVESALRFGLAPVRELLRNGVDAELFSADLGVSVSTVLLLLGGLVLAVACLNYGNLAVARAAGAVRAVGVRKALGAGPRQLALQHLVEAGALTAAALLVAGAVLAAALPPLEAVSGAPLAATLLADEGVWLFVLAVAGAVTLAAGGYPALVLARVEPTTAIRAAQTRLGGRRTGLLLVGAQFAVASALLIAVTVVARQNAELVRTGLGGLAEPVVLIDNRTELTRVAPETLRQELARVPQVRAVSDMVGLPWQRLVTVTTVSASPGAAAPRLRVLTRNVGYDFFDVLGIPLVAGRAFSPEHADFVDAAQMADSESPRAVVVDRALAAALGFERPADAIDRLVYFPLRRPGDAAPQATPLRIVGVAETRPLAFRGVGAAGVMYQLTPGGHVTLVSIDRGDVPAALAGIDAVWRRLAPDVAISRTFFDELFARAYETFVRLDGVFTALALTAIVISTTGLLGIATLVAGRRRAEIGVRKVCGARTSQLLLMLLGSFAKPVLVANVLAWPLMYLAAHRYLAVFAEPAPLTPAPFLAALALTAAVALLAVGGQALRAARAAPADVLRQE